MLRVAARPIEEHKKARLVVVTGATGYIGGRLVPRLLEAGLRVRALVRSPEKISDRPWALHPNLEVRQVDLSRTEELTAALQGSEAAYYLVHSMLAAQSDYASRDLELAKTFAQAGRAAALPRIVYLGGLGGEEEGLSEHLRSRREVEAALASTRVPVTVLRAAMILGSGSASFEILRYLVERLPVMVTPKWVQTRCQPIAIRNVINYLVSVIDVPATIGQTFDIGGIDVMSYREIMRIMAEEIGLPPRWIIPVPVLTPRLSSYWIHLVTPMSHNIARPLAEGLRNPVVCRDHRIRELISQDLLSVRASIRLALEKVATRGVETSWSMAGPIPGDPDWAGGTVFRDARKKTIAANGDDVFRAVCRVGGRNGWYSSNWLWRMRGVLDKTLGGPGLRRGRRDPEVLGYGEALDFWRVSKIHQNQLLRLRAEMKLPGDAMLEFRIERIGGQQSVLHQEATFAPRGLLGLLYWYAVLPLHHFVFRGMLDGIQREAERIASMRSAS